MAGVDIITHCSNVDDDTIRLMGEHETMVVPTMSWTYIKNPETSFESIRRLYDAGITLALGTDTAGTPLSFGKNALELEVYVEKLKLEPLEAIKIGTLNAAKTMGIEDLGTLDPKKLADIIAVDVNPLENIRSLQDEKNVKLVMKGGAIYKNIL
jgi:imidazolonepropionase-like amidohydrolase